MIATGLAADTFGDAHAEIRVGSGALANLYGFMALAKLLTFSWSATSRRPSP